MDVLSSLPIAVYTTDAEGFLTYYNEAAAEFWGCRPELGSARWNGAWRLYTPDGRPMRHEDSPFARTLRDGAPVCNEEAVSERPDGTRVTFVPHPTLVRDEAGDVVGGVNVLVDVTERRATEIDLARLAAIVSSSDDAIVSKTLDGIVTTWNAGATRIFGYTSDEIVGRHIATIIPPELLEEEEAILATLRRGERIDHFDTVRVTRDGRRLPISLTVSPIRNAAGEVVGASKVARDVSERKRVEELQRLLVDELNHRVKNTLATIQAVARQSLRTEPDPSAFVVSFTGRLQALARAHDVLTRGEMQRAGLAELVREQVDLGTSDSRVSASGPLVRLDSRVAVQMALVLHELATNARKYGALSVATGRLDVSWTISDVGERELTLTWRESGVPRVTVPERHGFGTLLIERSLVANGGDTRLHYRGDGLVCEIRLPIPADAPAGERFRESETPGRPGRSRVAGRCVLVVEDEPLIAMDIEDRLLAAGCEVIGPAATVATAMRLASELPLDAALLDVNLGGRPVDALAAELARRGIPFAFATGFGRQSLPAQFQDAPLIAKPYDGAELVETVRSLLDSRKQAEGVIRLRPAAG